MMIELRFDVLVTGRFILGILVGISTAIVPRFVKIMSPTQIAGKMGTYNQLMQTFGVLFSCMMGFLVMRVGGED
jgi:cyanate permease